MKSKFVNFSILEINEYTPLLILLTLLPVTLLFGAGANNINVILIDVYFLYIIIKKKNIFFLKDIIFFHLIFFTFYLIIISFFFSIDKVASIERSFGLLRFIILAFAVKFFFEKNEKNTSLLKLWLLVFFLINLDLFFEIIFGENILGFKSRLPYRLVSFSNEELNIGNYYYGFSLISLCAVYKLLKKNYYITILLIIILTLGFLIGERSNFIKLFIASLIFYYFFYNNYKKLLKVFLYILIFLIFYISFNNSFYDRYYIKIIQPLFNNGYVNLIKETQYGSHHLTAIKIFKENKLFGTGIKSYRKECSNEKYFDKSLKFPDLRCSTHPHQVHLEFLSETGLVGYFIFLYVFSISIFCNFKNFKKNKNLLSLAGMLIVATSLLPIIPSGSFFSTYGATIFWINFGLMIHKINK